MEVVAHHLRAPNPVVLTYGHLHAILDGLDTQVSQLEDTHRLMLQHYYTGKDGFRAILERVKEFISTYRTKNREGLDDRAIIFENWESDRRLCRARLKYIQSQQRVFLANASEVPDILVGHLLIDN